MGLYFFAGMVPVPASVLKASTYLPLTEKLNFVVSKAAVIAIDFGDVEFHHHFLLYPKSNLKLFFNLVSVKVYDKVTGNLNFSLLSITS
jgi:hypothetical protein